YGEGLGLGEGMGDGLGLAEGLGLGDGLESSIGAFCCASLVEAATLPNSRTVAPRMANAAVRMREPTSWNEIGRLAGKRSWWQVGFISFSSLWFLLQDHIPLGNAGPRTLKDNRVVTFARRTQSCPVQAGPGGRAAAALEYLGDDSSDFRDRVLHFFPRRR
ncbi:MAG: hypothetical protein M3429_06490, partial [Verrucomicrobiota bacterium]|nr:hypothetical protein [Verrucomicrobiota bacterium]